jgi:hypothetical protein
MLRNDWHWLRPMLPALERACENRAPSKNPTLAASATFSSEAASENRFSDAA